MRAARGVDGAASRGALDEARAFLLRAAACLPAARWAERPSAAYSPVGWHLGHVAATQARWLLPGDPLGERFGGFFDPAQTSKTERSDLPAPEQLLEYLGETLETVRRRLWDRAVPAVPGLPHDFLVHSIAQHELQHAEHVRVIAALCERRLQRAAPAAPPAAGRVEFAGGDASIGCDDVAEAYDNERPAQAVRVAPFWMDSAPVTAGQFAEFVQAGGYRSQRWWTPEGWRWRAANEVGAPLGWPDVQPGQAVSCISWYEADAYARWRGARLPTEAEWETARRAGLPGCGQVWEWTASWFLPYPGFRPYPYDRYSTPWFGTHRVLRGGSWATHSRLGRPSFRNWYVPGFREIPAGLRCAGDL